MLDVFSRSVGLRLAAGAAVLLAGAGLGMPAAQAAPEGTGALLAHVDQPAGWGDWSRAAIVDYRTEGPTGGLVDSAGLVLLPDSPAPTGGYPIVAWDHGTSGLGPQCGITTTKAAHDRPLLQAFLDRGWAVVAPDYVGLSPNSRTVHPYLHTRTEATATVDLVKAARSAVPALSNTWAVVGSSQGGHAALATGNLATGYAPDLDFRGTVAMAPESNYENILAQVGPQVPNLPMVDRLTGPFAGMLAGLRATRPDLDVNGHLSEPGRNLVDAISTACVQDFDKLSAGMSLGSILAKPMADNGIGSGLRDYMVAPTAGYQEPVLITHGATDTVVPIPMTFALLSQLRASGTRVEFEMYPVAHEEIEEASRDRVLTFVDGLLRA